MEEVFYSCAPPNVCWYLHLHRQMNASVHLEYNVMCVAHSTPNHIKLFDLFCAFQCDLINSYSPGPQETEQGLVKTIHLPLGVSFVRLLFVVGVQNW